MLQSVALRRERADSREALRIRTKLSPVWANCQHSSPAIPLVPVSLFLPVHGAWRPLTASMPTGCSCLGSHPLSYLNQEAEACPAAVLSTVCLTRSGLHAVQNVGHLWETKNDWVCKEKREGAGKDKGKRGGGGGDAFWGQNGPKMSEITPPPPSRKFHYRILYLCVFATPVAVDPEPRSVISTHSTQP